MVVIFFRTVLYCQILLVCMKNSIAQQIRDNISDYDWSVWCKFQPNGFDCTAREPMQPKFYYDLKMEDCMTFTFGLCGTSKNHFDTITQCHEHCRDVGLKEARANVSEKIYCRYQPDFGECNKYYPMWYFDMSRRVCRGFSYSGCGGNMNRFPNSQMCIGMCAGVVEY